ncbi:hypothetical protein SAMN05216570_3830 [Dyella sp. OK004]|uniref:hypothetical protein n=1 Tax=Dyella sp. OK004 TaxID=1855292 RepID=UPI0008DEB877|nr:hypothetical protein [Dyella sp. OK004]SFS18841.1 hypothetical protein SAMN05216570_3830 [Dyella sp. OK004]
MKKSACGIGLLSLLIAGAVAAQGAAFSGDDQPLIVTASNTTQNKLMIYSPSGNLLGQLPTGGAGGVSGNAGGIAQDRERLAVVNFGSGNVSVFANDFEHGGLRVENLIPAVANPVSVAFGHDHLYILTTTHIESHRIDRHGVAWAADGQAKLVLGDGSAAQVGTLQGELIMSEKNNVIETVKLDGQGAITGTTQTVSHIPTNVNAPFGLATRGDNAYVTIAHANEISLVRDDQVLTTTSSGTQSAPCWVTLDGPFLFSANSPSKSVSRYAVYGQKIIQDAAVVASFNGNPTDITYRSKLAAVIDSNGSASHVSIFDVDGDGNFALKGLATINSATTNGVAIVRRERDAH